MSAAAPSFADDDAGWEWARVVTYGQKTHVGRARAEPRMGVDGLRIQIPVDGQLFGRGTTTVWVALHKIVFYAPITRDAAMEASWARGAATPRPFNDEDDPSQRYDGFGAT